MDSSTRPSRSSGWYGRSSWRWSGDDSSPKSAGSAGSSMANRRWWETARPSSGFGKELVARELHRLGPHPTASFLAINCAALPEQLVESELFGHERGAFTGATATRKGAFEAAERGTLFLDEIGELPLAAQAKFLRVLEERQVTRVGGTRPLPVDARVVAATNRDLEAEVRAGRFREDLYYRINVHRIEVPPLRERQSDVPEIAGRFVVAVCQRFGIRP